MSHFTVLVIGGDVEKQLAPFQENNMGDCPKKFLEFEDMTEEIHDGFYTGTSTMVVMPDGTHYDEYDYDFVFNIPEEFQSRSFHDTYRSYPMGTRFVEVPHYAIYKTIDNYAAKYHGYNSKDEETGKYGYWSNPNARWDWYQIGGRWTGYFKLKEGKIGGTGTPGLMTNKNTDPTRADQALKSDIDFEFMRNEAEKRATDRWDAANILMGDTRSSYRDWSRIREKYAGNIELARKVYHDQEAVKAFKNDPEHQFTWSHEDIMCSREECIRNARNSAITTFALLKDGVWYEKGSMGWLGIVSDEKDKNKWNKEFTELIDSLPDDTLLTVVDCHI